MCTTSCHVLSSCYVVMCGLSDFDKSLTLKKRSRESWMERRGRVFFRRGKSIDKSLNCSRFVTTSPQLHQMGKRRWFGYNITTCLMDEYFRLRSSLALTICTVSCAGPQTPCWLPLDRCRCEMCPPRRLGPAWMPKKSLPGCLRPPEWSTKMKTMTMRVTRLLHPLSSCSFSLHHPSAGPNTDWETRGHPRRRGLSTLAIKSITYTTPMCGRGWMSF